MRVSAGFRHWRLRCGFVFLLTLPACAAMAQSAAQLAPVYESAPPLNPLAASQDTPSVQRAALASLDPITSVNLEPEFIPVTSVIPDTQPKTARPVRCDIDSLRQCLKDLLDDEVGMWTSSLRVRKKDALWLLPLGALTAAALTTDGSVSAKVGFNPSRIRFSSDFSNGMEDGSIGVAAGLYFLGKFTHNETARETGILSLEAIADATIAVEVLKLATNRVRPKATMDASKFWPDDSDIFSTSGSFPSGHSATVWAFAHVVVDETPGKLWVHILMYALATGTSVTRVTAQEHFPSDVLVGSAIGYLVGGYVYRHHSAAGGREGIPVMILPFSDLSTRSTGIAVAIDPAAFHWNSLGEFWSKLAGANSLFHRTGN